MSGNSAQAPRICSPERRTASSIANCAQLRVPPKPRLPGLPGLPPLSATAPCSAASPPRLASCNPHMPYTRSATSAPSSPRAHLDLACAHPSTYTQTDMLVHANRAAHDFVKTERAQLTRTSLPFPRPTSLPSLAASAPPTGPSFPHRGGPPFTPLPPLTSSNAPAAMPTSAVSRGTLPQLYSAPPRGVPPSGVPPSSVSPSSVPPSGYTLPQLYSAPPSSVPPSSVPPSGVPDATQAHTAVPSHRSTLPQLHATLHRDAAPAAPFASDAAPAPRGTLPELHSIATLPVVPALVLPLPLEVHCSRDGVAPLFLSQKRGADHASTLADSSGLPLRVPTHAVSLANSSGIPLRIPTHAVSLANSSGVPTHAVSSLPPMLSPGCVALPESSRLLKRSRVSVPTDLGTLGADGVLDCDDRSLAWGGRRRRHISLEVPPPVPPYSADSAGAAVPNAAAKPWSRCDPFAVRSACLYRACSFCAEWVGKCAC